MKSKFTLTLDLSKSGFDMFFKPYHKIVFDVLWENPEGLNSRMVWELVNSRLTGSISRASIINFLSDVAELGLLEYREESGKGGFHRIYWHKYDRNGFREHIKDSVKKALQTLFN
jgi:hypothetical protein